MVTFIKITNSDKTEETIDCLYYDNVLSILQKKDSLPLTYKCILSISDITRNKYQPRKVFDNESLQELTN